MCAISGIIIKNEKCEKDTRSILNMVNSQSHRGPDDCGICGISLGGKKSIVEYSTEYPEDCKQDTRIVLGHNRLSILDLSPLGHQPMISSDGTVVIVYNGEVYNAFEERKELEKKGVKFRSNTDTEIILELYREYGIDEMLKRLNGMFAFGIYDLNSGKAYLARDRFGIKPIYYFEDDEMLLFASEVKAITKSGKINVAIDIEGFQETFAFGMSYQKTIIEGIHPLQAGCYLEWDKKSTKLYRFYDINEYKKVEKTGIDVVKRKGKEVLRKSVESQMISDVCVGCQLSGGVDSSLVSYFAVNNNKTQMRDSIAITFDDEYGQLNEEKYIDYVSEQLRLKCHKQKMDGDFYIRNLEKINWHLDNIPAYYNELGILLLSKEAKKYVTVLLSGEGADELFAGYTRMAYSKIVKMASIVHRVIPKTIKAKIWKGRSGNRYVDYVVFKEAVPLELCEKVLKEYDDERISRDRIQFAEGLKGSSLDIQRKYEMSIRLQGLLNRQDKSTMANSIENRVPVLDNNVVDWAFSLKKSSIIKVRVMDLLKRTGTRIQGKYVLKSICSDIFGKEFSYRDKGGFGIPCRDYMKKPIFLHYVEESILPCMKERGLINYQYIEKWMHNLDKISALEENALWRAINLEILCQLLVDGRAYKEIV